MIDAPLTEFLSFEDHFVDFSVRESLDGDQVLSESVCDGIDGIVTVLFKFFDVTFSDSLDSLKSQLELQNISRKS